MGTTTHPDSLWPTRVGGKLQQQGEGGAGAKGSELRAIRMIYFKIDHATADWLAEFHCQNQPIDLKRSILLPADSIH